MRKITKTPEPSLLGTWKRKNPSKRYADLDQQKDGHTVRQAIRQACLVEQYYLCAYCCRTIDLKNAVNEHLVPQDTSPKRSLDFTNIVASCDTIQQCDKAHKNQYLPLTPLMNECESELEFFVSGEIKGNTGRASETIQVLNLNSRSLINQRKEAISSVLYTEGIHPNKFVPEDDSLISMLIEDLLHTHNGELTSYAPIIIKALKKFI